MHPVVRVVLLAVVVGAAVGVVMFRRGTTHTSNESIKARCAELVRHVNEARAATPCQSDATCEVLTLPGLTCNAAVTTQAASKMKAIGREWRDLCWSDVPRETKQSDCMGGLRARCEAGTCRGVPGRAY